MLRYERYSDTLRGEWDALVERSRSGSFLHLRDYMAYHADRFSDHSLLLRGEDGRVLALLPANQREGVLESHGGLSWGGLLFEDDMTLRTMLDAVAELRNYLRAGGFAFLRYGAVPSIYRRGPAAEDLWALSRHGARRIHCAALSVIDLADPIRPQARRARGARKAAAAGVEVAASDDLEAYWEVLGGVLQQKYGAHPVHSLAEIQLLARTFPGRIRLLGARENGEMVAGVLLYDSGRVVRTQYIAANERGKQIGALDLLFERLPSACGNARYLDLGSSEGEGPGGLNAGVLEFKESLGARTVLAETYELAAADA